jgi:predicted RNA-binding Zn-ribbon protein involved in translation (DUF1610 family)
MKLAVQVHYTKYLKEKVYEYFCTCGYHVKTKFSGSFQCPACGNEKILIFDRKYKTKIIYSKPYTVDIGLKHFHVAKDKYRVVFHNNNTITVKEVGKEELKFDLVSRKISLIRNGEEILVDERKIEQFFCNVSFGEILELISIRENRNLYVFAYKYLSREHWREWEYKIGKALVRLINKPYLELFYFGGFTSIEQLTNITRNYHYFNIHETKLHKILGVPKSFLPILRKVNTIYPEVFVAMTNLYEAIGGNNFKVLFDVLEHETDLQKLRIIPFCDYFKKLYTEFGYKNIERLAIYVCREVKLQQGIENPNDALMYLKDYVSMMNELGYEAEKYPKSLKKVHDIANMNYKIREDEILAEKFSRQVNEEEYKNLVYKGKEYSIITPKDSCDLVKEGESLSHCVASYVKDVANGLCKILFMRKNNCLDESCVTIEVRGNQIRQVRGRGNRAATANEREFVQEWANEKNLVPMYW